ncbi:MAG: TIGR03757 family integrating conjugative element protein [Chromatiaceae bacterium]|nr:TIGR03757 family integrating conjugative element protein [Chromatiaceae bacterium]
MASIVLRFKTDMLAIFHSLVRLMLFWPLAFSLPVWSGESFSVEVFTTSERPAVGADYDQLRAANVSTYTVDSFDRLESRLSEGLTADPEAAKRESLRRIQQLDDARMASVKKAAIGLSKAFQYNVNRYPAVVFNGEIVIYGVTDLSKAFDLYVGWKRERSR